MALLANATGEASEQDTRATNLIIGDVNLLDHFESLVLDGGGV